MARITKKKRNTNIILVGKPEERKTLGRPRRPWWIILKWISKKHNGNSWTGLIWLGIGTSGGLLRTR